MRYVVLLLCLVAPLALRAEPVAIRTGEHDTFSRFVLAIPPGTGWEVAPNASGYVLTLSDTRARYQLDNVFERIPRDRVSDVQDRGGGRLEFVLACEACIADAFLWQADRLVVDIVDGPAAAPDAVPTVRSSGDSPLPLFPEPMPTPLRTPTDMFQSSLQRALSPQATPHYSEQGVAESIARAVAQGLLTPSTSGLPSQTTAEPTRPVGPPVVDMPEAAPIPAGPGITVGSALDRDLSALGLALGGLNADPCLGADLFAVTDWAEDRPFATQIADLSQGVAAELEQISPEAVMRLARGYIYYGFGQEALTALGLLDTNSQERVVLSVLAHSVDGLPGHASILSSQGTCLNGAAPWVVASGAGEFGDVDRDHLLQSYRLLPPAVQGVLAPSLSRAALEAGQVDAAALILSVVQGGDAARRAELREANTALAEATGGAAAALTLLQSQAQDDARMRPETLAQMIQLSVQSGTIPAQADLTLAAAMRAEYRHDPVAVDLALAEAAGHAANDDYEAAFALLETYASQLSEDRLLPQTSALAMQLVDHAGDVAFLDVVFSDALNPLSAEAENAVARRLLALHFPEKAEQFLSGPASQQAMAERRYLRARAAIELHHPEEALTHIQGLTDPEAETIRAQALAQLGDMGGAFAATRPDTALDIDAAFRAGAWERLSLSDDPLMRAVAEDILTGASPDGFAGITDREAALASATRTREHMANLLARYPVDPVAAD